MKNEIERDVRRDVDIDREDITNEMIELPAIFSYWYALHVEAELKQKEAEISLDIWLANKKIEVANEHMLSGGKKDLTEIGKKELVMTKYTDAYMSQHQALMKYERDASILKGNVAALKIKSEMLISIGAQHRNEREMSAGISTKDRMSGVVHK